MLEQQKDQLHVFFLVVWYSSLVACLVDKYKKAFIGPDEVLNTFSIGLEGSEDLKYAKIVAQHINSNHHEIIVSEQDFFDAIPEL